VSLSIVINDGIKGLDEQEIPSKWLAECRKRKAFIQGASHWFKSQAKQVILFILCTFLEWFAPWTEGDLDCCDRLSWHVSDNYLLCSYHRNTHYPRSLDLQIWTVHMYQFQKYKYQYNNAVCFFQNRILGVLTMRFATCTISGKYRIVGRNFSCISHKKNAVVLDANLPSFCAAILHERRLNRRGVMHFEQAQIPWIFLE
jgi:hypothetical protein